jgi:hypothetical protein
LRSEISNLRFWDFNGDGPSVRAAIQNGKGGIGDSWERKFRRSEISESSDLEIAQVGDGSRILRGHPPHSASDAQLLATAALTIFVRSAGLVVQVPLAGDVGILRAVGPAADLAGDGFAAGFEI